MKFHQHHQLHISSQTPTQQLLHTVSTIKLPILKKGEYDIWAMKMEHYLAYTERSNLEVITKNRNCPVINHYRYIRDKLRFGLLEMQKRLLPRKREKSRTTFAYGPYQKDHLAKFLKMTMQKEMWDAIKL
ncbi:hypothetical protein Tco_1162521 [Tanacetum coccineum]